MPVRKKISLQPAEGLKEHCYRAVAFVQSLKGGEELRQLSVFTMLSFPFLQPLAVYEVALGEMGINEPPSQLSHFVHPHFRQQLFVGYLGGCDRRRESHSRFAKHLLQFQTVQCLY